MSAVGSEAGTTVRSLRIGGLAGGVPARAGADAGRARRGAARRAGVRLATLRFGAARFGAARFGAARFGAARFAAARVAAVLRAGALRAFAARDRVAPRRDAAARLDEVLLFGLAFAFAFAGVGLRAFGFLAAIFNSPRFQWRFPDNGRRASVRSPASLMP